MISAASETWVQRIKSGTLNVADLDDLTDADAAEVVDRLSELYPVRFLEGSQRNKREVGLCKPDGGRSTCIACCSPRKATDSLPWRP